MFEKYGDGHKARELELQNMIDAISLNSKFVLRRRIR